MPIKVFVDFDGTITQQDIGNAFFRRFGGPVCDEFVGQYRTGKLSAVECFNAEAAAAGVFKKSEAEQFLHTQPIDETFAGFVQFCGEHNIDVTVLSDGLDYYILQILGYHGIHGVNVYANHAELVEVNTGVRLDVTFPHTDAECSRCACCKRNLMLTKTGEEDLIVYVGEGYSDRCPARYADLVFAKSELQTFCQSENISYFLYHDFSDVQARLRTLLVKKRLRKRVAAEHLRRELFMRE